VIDDEDDELDELPVFQPSASAGLTARAVDDYLEGKPMKTSAARLEADGAECALSVRSVLKT
jgi:hypothetical protein